MPPKKESRRQERPQATDEALTDNESGEIRQDSSPPPDPGRHALSSPEQALPFALPDWAEEMQRMQRRFEKDLQHMHELRSADRHEQQTQFAEQRAHMDRMQQQMLDAINALSAQINAQAPAAKTPPPAAARTPPTGTQAASGQPPPAQDHIFHAQAAADRMKRDALETLRRLAPYEGKHSEAYSSPFDFIQAIERIWHHQHKEAGLKDEQVIAQVASLLQYDALGWFNATFPSGTQAHELRNWSLFRVAFLAEHQDPQQVFRAADDLVSPERVRQHKPTAFSLDIYDTQVKRLLNTLSTSATMGQPNASGPPNEKWTMLIYYSGLHPDIRTILAPERASITTLAQLRARAQAVATPDEVPGTANDDSPDAVWRNPPRSQARRGRSNHAMFQDYCTRPTTTSTVAKAGKVLCTHEFHRGQVNHTWHQCMLNPASPQYNPAVAAKAEQDFNARNAHAPHASALNPASAQAGRAFHTSAPSVSGNGFASLAHEVAAHEYGWLEGVVSED